MNTTQQKLVTAIDLAIEVLFKATQSSAGLAILIDPALADPLHPSIEELGLQPIRLRIATRQIDTDKLPYLVWIADASRAERLVSASIRIAIAERLSPEADWPAGMRSVCAWFVSPALSSESDAKSLARRLAAQGMQSDASSNRHYFRFFDPRIAIHLAQILEPAQRQALARSTGNGWHCMDEQGELQTLPLATTSTTQSNAIIPLAELPEAAPVALTPEQWQNFVVVGWRNRIAQALPDWELEQTPTPDALMDIARRAVGYKLTRDEDILCFAQYALTLHPLFDKHEKVVHALTQAGRSSEFSFATLAESWDAETLTEIHAGTWLRAQPESIQ